MKEKTKYKCGNCGKEYESEKVVSHLCNDCREKAKSLPKDDESKLSLFYKCEELGIISIME